MADLKGHANSLLEAFNTADWDGLNRLIGDSTYHELGTQRSLRGGEIIAALQGWRTAMPDETGTVTNVVEGGNQVVLEVTWEGNQTGPFVTSEGEIPPSGKHHRTPSAWVFDYEGERLKESRIYFDMLSFLQQIGAA